MEGEVPRKEDAALVPCSSPVRVLVAGVPPMGGATTEAGGEPTEPAADSGREEPPPALSGWPALPPAIIMESMPAPAEEA